MARTARVYGLQTRTLGFLTLFIGLVVYGAVLMAMGQVRISETSAQVREVLLPSSRLFEQAKNEIDLQIQEISLASQKNANAPIGPQNIGLLRLGPGVRSSLALRDSIFLTSRVDELYQAWVAAVADYQAKVTAEMSPAQSLVLLKALRQKTHLVHRAIDREFSFQLYNLSDHTERHLSYWLGALLALVGLALVFIYLLWRWMKPLDAITHWLEATTRLAPGGALSPAPHSAVPPPPAPAQRGLLAPPREILELVDALRFHIEKYKDQSRELEFRSSRNDENERAISTLFSASLYLSRHNEELLKELIKSERLASMGEMAAQLAHEIRNPLNSLNLKLELLREDMTEGFARDQLDKVLGEIDRLNNLTEDHLIKTRARLRGDVEASGALLLDGGAPIETHLVADSARDVIETLKPELDRAGIEVVVEHRDPDVTTPVPAKPLKAVLVNLVKNAREAIEEKPEGPRRVLVVTRLEGDRWVVEVNDSGVGFPEGFHPSAESFQSTKKQGFGLGLATSLKMLQRWGGTISVHAGLPPYVSSVRASGPVGPQKPASTDAAIARALDDSSNY